MVNEQHDENEQFKAVENYEEEIKVGELDRHERLRHFAAAFDYTEDDLPEPDRRHYSVEGSNNAIAHFLDRIQHELRTANYIAYYKECMGGYDPTDIHRVQVLEIIRTRLGFLEY